MFQKISTKWASKWAQYGSQAHFPTTNGPQKPKLFKRSKAHVKVAPKFLHGRSLLVFSGDGNFSDDVFRQRWSSDFLQQMGRLFLQELPGPAVYCCRTCELTIATPEQVHSTNFHGRLGQAYLLDSVVNVVHGPNQDCSFISGEYTVNDINCRRCLQLLGWSYVKAPNNSEKYKEGKYVLEIGRLKKMLMLYTV